MYESKALSMSEAWAAEALARTVWQTSLGNPDRAKSMLQDAPPVEARVLDQGVEARFERYARRCLSDLVVRGDIGDLDHHVSIHLLWNPDRELALVQMARSPREARQTDSLCEAAIKRGPGKCVSASVVAPW